MEDDQRKRFRIGKHEEWILVNGQSEESRWGWAPHSLDNKKIDKYLAKCWDQLHAGYNAWTCKGHWVICTRVNTLMGLERKGLIESAEDRGSYGYRSHMRTHITPAGLEEGEKRRQGKG